MQYYHSNRDNHDKQKHWKTTTDYGTLTSTEITEFIKISKQYIFFFTRPKPKQETLKYFLL